MYVDGYCERVAPGLWGEPANAVSNVAFFVAAGLLAWLLSGQRRRAPLPMWLVPILLATVGACSLAFHLAATRATSALDSLAIIAFILLVVVLLVRWTWGIRWRWAWLAAPAYLAAAVGMNAALAAVAGERATLGGYLPALVVLVGFGVAVRHTARPPGRRAGGLLLVAAAIFAVSLTLRTLDEPLCARFPLGTHFVWHILNAAVLFLVGYAVSLRQQASDPHHASHAG